MAIEFQTAVRDGSGNPRQLALDITGATYTLVIDGANVSAAPAQPSDTKLVKLTAGGVDITLLAVDVGRVGFGGPARIAAGAGATVQSALGRVACLALAAGVTQTTIFGTTGGG